MRQQVSHHADSPPAADADGPLVTAALAGDRGAFDQLVLRRQDGLFNGLVRMGSSPEDAADAVQEAFVQAWVKLASFRGTSQFSTWLYRIAMNVSHSRRRRKRPTVSLEAFRAAAGVEPADHAPGPEGHAATHERIAAVQSALAEVGEQQRQILVLREIEGASYEEIAEILELPIGTVRSRLFRARMELREKLSNFDRHISAGVHAGSAPTDSPR